MTGRKTIRRMAEQVGGRSVEQALQQFVNQSPWDSSAVRNSLTWAVDGMLPSVAWVVQEIEFAKDGRNSVGVASQFVSREQRTVNCQVALTIWAGAAQGSVPANWRLMLPQAWDGDIERRSKAHVPISARHLPCWEHILDSVDEMVGPWNLAPRPVVGDRRYDRQLAALVAGLEDRCLDYAFRVDDRTPVTGQTRRGVRLTAGALARSADRTLVTMPAPGDPGGTRGHRPHSIVVAQVMVPAAAAPSCTSPGRPRPRRIVARWPHGREHPVQLWLTNLPAAPVPELIGILDVAQRATRDLDRLRSESGLDHFEGRSFRGWHHHVTLASVAHAYRVLEEQRPGQMTGGCRAGS